MKPDLRVQRGTQSCKRGDFWYNSIMKYKYIIIYGIVGVVLLQNIYEDFDEINSPYDSLLDYVGNQYQVSGAISSTTTSDVLSFPLL